MLCEVLTGYGNRQGASRALVGGGAGYRAGGASARIRAGGGDPAGRPRVGGRVHGRLAERGSLERADPLATTTTSAVERPSSTPSPSPLDRHPSTPSSTPTSTGPSTTGASSPIEPVEPTLGVGDELFPGLGSSDIDVVAYDVALTYDPTTDQLAGTVSVELVLLVDADTVPLDATDLAVASVSVDGDEAQWSTPGDELLVELPEPRAAGSTVKVDVTYEAPSRLRSTTTGFPGRLVRHRGRFVRAERARWRERVASRVRPPLRQGNVAVRDHGARGDDGHRQRRTARRGPRR